MLTWMTPGWLLGMFAAVAAPLVAHLLSRKGGTLAAFPTVRFIEKAAADIARLERPRHWLLLLLRIAALTLVVLAFAQPRWLRSEPIHGEQGVCVAIVIDRSASMQRHAGTGVTLFEEARRQARAMLQSLDPARDTAVVVLAGRSPDTLLAEPSSNFSQLIANLDVAEGSFERGALDQAIDLAFAAARRREVAVQVELLTDLQQSQFPRAAIARCRMQHVEVRVHPIGAFAENLAIHDATLFPSQPIAQQPAVLRARVTHFGQSQRTVMARCGDQSQTLRLWPWRSAEVMFDVTFDQPGPTSIGITIEVDDAMDMDNAVGQVVDVAAARSIKLVTPGSFANTLAPQTAAYFLARALAPSHEGQAEGVALSIISPEQLASLTPTPGEVWVLVEAGAIDHRSREVMMRHMEVGGGILWVVDSPAAAASIAGWEPAPIVEGRWQDAQVKTLAIGRFDDPILAAFEGPGRSALLDQTFKRGVVGRVATHAEGILLADDGSPVLATSWRGAGRCAMWMTDLSPASTSFVKTAVWPALVHQIVRHLAPGRPPPATRHPGDVLNDGTIARTAGLIQTAKGGAWVQLDLDESDLRTAELQQPADADETIAAASSPLRPVEHELWPWLMLAGLGLLAIETLVMWQLSRGRGGSDV